MNQGQAWANECEDKSHCLHASVPPANFRFHQASWSIDRGCTARVNQAWKSETTPFNDPPARNCRPVP